MTIPPGATSQSIQVQLTDDAGLALTGKVAADFPTTSYQKAGANALVGITLSDLAALTTAYSSGGVKEIGGGWYRLDLPDAALSTATRLVITGDAAGKHVIAPPIDVQYVLSDAAKINGVATSSVTTIGANIGSTQPFNFTGIGGSALVKSDMVDIAGAAVSDSAAQIGVNVVNFGGSAGTFASGRPEVNTTNLFGIALTTTAGTGFKTFFDNAGSASTLTTNALDTRTATIPADVLGTVVPGSFAASTVGKLIGDNVNATITSRMATFTYTAPLDSAGVATAVWGAARASYSVSGSFGAGVLIFQNNDKTGYSLAADQAVNVTKFGGTTVTARDIGASVLLSSGTGTGQLNFTSGVVNANVTAMAASVITASSLATDAGAELADAVWDEATAGHATAGTTGKALADAGGGGGTDPWIADLSTYTAGQAGYEVHTKLANLDGLVSDAVTNSADALNEAQVATATAQVAVDNTADILADLPANLSALAINSSGHVILQNGSLVTAKLGTFVLAKTSNLTGFNDLSAVQVNAEADTALADVGLTTTITGRIDANVSSRMATFTVPGSFAAADFTRLDATVGSRLATAGYTAPDNAGITTLTGRLTSGRAANLDNLDAAISSRMATFTYTAPSSLASIIAGVWNEPQASHTTAGTFGKFVDSAISGVSTGGVTADEIADAVLEELIGDHTTAGTVGKALGDAASAGDPWSTDISAYIAGTAGYIVRTSLDASISSRFAGAAYTAPDNAGITTLTGRLTAGRASGLDNLDTSMSSRLAASAYTVPPSAAVISDTVWDEVMAAHATAGSAGAELTEGGSASGGGLMITPIQAIMTNPRYATRDLPPIAQGSAPTEIWVITDGLGNAVNLSGKVIHLVAYTVDDPDEDVRYDEILTPAFQYSTTDGDITIGGANSNQLTITHDPLKTDTAGEFRYWLWNVTDKLPLAKGRLPIEPALIAV